MIIWVIKVRAKEGTPIAVILSEAKNLSYQVTPAGEILRFAQNDKNVTRLFYQTSYNIHHMQLKQWVIGSEYQKVRSFITCYVLFIAGG